MIVGSQDKPARDELSLLELRGNTFVADRFGAMSVGDGLLKLADLPPGDYDLLLKHSGTIPPIGYELDGFIFPAQYKLKKLPQGHPDTNGICCYY